MCVCVCEKENTQVCAYGMGGGGGGGVTQLECSHTTLDKYYETKDIVARLLREGYKARLDLATLLQ